MTQKSIPFTKCANQKKALKEKLLAILSSGGNFKMLPYTLLHV
jgi:hypothetical protein